MLSQKTLIALLPFLTATNALLFEPPSASALKRHGDIARRAHHDRRQSGDSWVAAGCYTDNMFQRTLPAYTVTSGTMTNDACKAICDERGYAIAATEWSEECFCDDDFHNGGVKTADAECDMMCIGAPTEVCGGGLRLTVWTKPASTLESYGNWNSQGCFVDSINARIVPNSVSVDGDFTPQKCMDACAAQGYEYAGLEYSHECYCANGLNTASLQQVDISECNSRCEGDAAHYCGAGNRLNLYKHTATIAPGTDGWTYDNCYSDNMDSRTLGLRVYVDGGMTPTKCNTKCLSLGYSHAGVEYSDECYCANSIGSSGTQETDGCTMSCSGDRNTICGGGNRITVYKYTSTALPTPASVLESYGEWTSAGCYVDSMNARVLTPNTNAQRPMTVQNCIDACAASGYTVAGLEYAEECYCGLALPPVLAADNCIMKCEGDEAHLCGGPNRLNVYKHSLVTPTSTTDSSTSTTDSSTSTNDSSTSTTDSATSTSTSDSSSSTASPSSTSTETESFTTTVDTSTSTPTQTQAADPWIDAGCQVGYAQYSMWMQTGMMMGSQSVKTCTTMCDQYGMGAARITNGGICTCMIMHTPSSTGVCNARCLNDFDRFCGSWSDRNAGSTYIKPVGQQIAMPTSPQAASWVSQGCYLPNGLYEAVLNDNNSLLTMSKDKCTQACQALNKPVAVIFSLNQPARVYQTCGCGTTLPPTATSSDMCDKVCGGNASQNCGGHGYITAYQFI